MIVTSLTKAEIRKLRTTYGKHRAEAYRTEALRTRLSLSPDLPPQCVRLVWHVVTELDGDLGALDVSVPSNAANLAALDGWLLANR